MWVVNPVSLVGHFVAGCPARVLFGFLESCLHKQLYMIWFSLIGNFYHPLKKIYPNWNLIAFSFCKKNQSILIKWYNKSHSHYHLRQNQKKGEQTNLSGTNFVWPRNIVLQVHLITKVHFSSAHLQKHKAAQTFLTSLECGKSTKPITTNRRIGIDKW